MRGTEKLQALYKTKIAKLKTKIEKKPLKAKHAASFHINSVGAGQIILIGPSNCGKSTLIRSLTNATPEIGNYPFTTQTALPAMRMDNLKELIYRIFLLLDVLRFYSKTPGKKASFDKPYVFKKGSTLLAWIIHE